MKLLASFAWGDADTVGSAPGGCELELLRGSECVWIIMEFGSEQQLPFTFVFVAICLLGREPSSAAEGVYVVRELPDLCFE